MGSSKHSSWADHTFPTGRRSVFGAKSGKPGDRRLDLLGGSRKLRGVLAHDPNGDDSDQHMNDIEHFERVGVVYVESTEAKMENGGGGVMNAKKAKNGTNFFMLPRQGF